ncbi:hypothetical protein EDB89DRAFT_1508926 [Lactarius sanguifluus]|nr:hypothetical protein EDB89DRAFT_1508926 [Lactarius sanguifluus]
MSPRTGLMIYDLCRKATNGTDPQDLRIQLSFCLSAASFSKSKWAGVIPFIAIIATDQLFRDLHPLPGDILYAFGWPTPQSHASPGSDIRLCLTHTFNPCYFFTSTSDQEEENRQAKEDRIRGGGQERIISCRTRDPKPLARLSVCRYFGTMVRQVRLSSTICEVPSINLEEYTI